jgi:hypothetical protein
MEWRSIGVERRGYDNYFQQTGFGAMVFGTVPAADRYTLTEEGNGFGIKSQICGLYDCFAVMDRIRSN